MSYLIMWGLIIIKHEIRILSLNNQYNGKYVFFFRFSFKVAGVSWEKFHISNQPQLILKGLFSLKYPVSFFLWHQLLLSFGDHRGLDPK